MHLASACFRGAAQPGLQGTSAPGAEPAPDEWLGTLRTGEERARMWFWAPRMRQVTPTSF